MRNENIHKIVPSDLLDTELKDFSEEGFELVSAILIPSEDEAYTQYYHLFLKRLNKPRKTKSQGRGSKPIWQKVKDLEDKGFDMPPEGPEYCMGEWLLHGRDISTQEALILITANLSRILREDDEQGLLTINDPSEADLHEFRNLIGRGEHEEALNLLWEAYFDPSKKDQRN